MKARNQPWQIQKAKQCFGEVVRLANADGPEMIKSRENILDFFQRSPHREIDLKIERGKDLPRKIDL